MRALILAVLLILPAIHPQSNRIHRHPIELSAYGLIFTRVQVNGGEAVALVDSGSFRTIQLSSSLAAELHLSTTETNKVARRYEGKEIRLRRAWVEKLVIGDDSKSDLELDVIEGDIEQIAGQVGTKFDVILGWGFLSRYHVLLDYKNLQMQWIESPLEAGQETMSFAYTIVNNVPVVQGTIDGRPVNFLFDTGAPMCNLDLSLTREPAGGKVSKEVSLGANKLSQEFRVKDISVIRQSLGCNAVIGNNLLSGYKVYLDTTNKVIRLY